MFGLLVRWFGPESRDNRRGAGAGMRFIPRLEALGDRIAPGGASGGVLVNVYGSTVSPMHSTVSPMHIGEEIPQMPPGRYPLGGAAGGVAEEW